MLHDDVEDALSVRHWRVALSSTCGSEVGIGGGWNEEEEGWNRSEKEKGVQQRFIHVAWGCRRRAQRPSEARRLGGFEFEQQQLDGAGFVANQCRW